VNAQLLRKFNPTATDLQNMVYNPLLEFFFNGVKAQDIKSKFFHWFLILEHLEELQEYKIRWKKDRLFSKIEQSKIKEFANNFNDHEKKGLIRGVLLKTKKSRAEKLYTFLREIGIETYPKGFSKQILTVGNIRNILNIRNKLFHEGKTFDPNILWTHLFPLVRKVVETSFSNQILLKKNHRGLSM